MSCIFYTSPGPQSSKNLQFIYKFVFVVTSLLMYSLNSCQRFSIGLASGDSAGVHQWTLLSSKKAHASLEVYLPGFFLEYDFREGKSTFLEIEGGTNYIY